MSVTRMRPLLPCLATLVVAAAPGRADFNYSGCPAYKMDEFRYVRVINRAVDSTLDQPVRMAFDYRGEGKSDIYFGERHGRIKRWDAVKKEMTVLGRLDVWSNSADKPDAEGSETGINGLALDPGFKDNQRLWIFYSPYKDTVFRLSRFTLKEGKLDMASEKVLLDIPEGRRHVSAITIGGGAMAFDPDGNLLVAIGANSEQYPSVDEKIRKRSAEASSANLADLRGSIIRIRPDESAKGYSIPKGNFAEHWIAEMEKQGRSALAREYADPAKVRPEIYVKGTRNPYSLHVDPKTRYAVWGDFGPTQQRTEELNLTTRPHYAGYPYWAGQNLFVLDMVQPWASAGMKAEAPVNNSQWNTGPKELPPAEPSIIAFAHEMPGAAFLRDGFPTSGPVYRYDEKVDSHVKFPPHFDGAWFATGRFIGLRMFKFNDAGTALTDSAVFKGAAGEPTAHWVRPIELKQGPDGALYLLEFYGYNESTPLTHIGRYEYTGSCKPGVPTLSRPPRKLPEGIRVGARAIAVDRPGAHRVLLRDAGGRLVANLSGEGPRTHELGAPAAPGLYLLTVQPGGETWKFPWF